MFGCVCLSGYFFRQLMWQSEWQVQAKYLNKAAENRLMAQKRTYLWDTRRSIYL